MHVLHHTSFDWSQRYGIITAVQKVSHVVHGLLLFCLFGVYRPTRKVCTHMETSPLH